MAHLAYAAMLVFCLAATVPLVFLLALRPIYRLRRVLTAICLAGAPFLAWDLAATHAGHWWFDARQTLPADVLGVPVEEILFFLVVPFSTIVTFEAVGALLARRAARR